jgi:hypothetical protein
VALLVEHSPIIVNGTKDPGGRFQRGSGLLQ